MLIICTTSADERCDNRILDSYIYNIGKGSKEALEALYTQTKSSVYSFALSILKNQQDAQDVLQDCFIKILTAASDYKTFGKPMAWILTITKNLCYLKIREKKKTDSLFEENLENLTAPALKVTTEDKIVLYKCMNDLSDVERQIVVLHAVSGLKHREISKVMDIPLSTVLSKYNRALKKLKNLLEESV